MQLYDLHADPSEANDLLVSSGSGGGGSGTHRNETSIAAALLGHYIAAVRVGRRSIERAYEEKRVNKGGVMVLWFCRQVEYSWSLSRWQSARRMMCYGRSERERRTLTAALADHAATSSPRVRTPVAGASSANPPNVAFSPVPKAAASSRRRGRRMPLPAP